MHDAYTEMNKSPDKKLMIREHFIVLIIIIDIKNR